MTGERRSYRRESEESRREALVLAALDLLAEGGPAVATVRAIADRAGVTPGLIRHYFAGKDDLTRAAYRYFMERMTAESVAAMAAGPDDPRARLSRFVTSSLRPPVMEPLRLSLWTGFLQLLHSDPEMRAIHRQTYHGYRDVLEALIVALARPGTDAARCRADAIACNGVIDGLWLEGAALPEDFSGDLIEQIGLRAVGAILGADLPEPEKDHP
ncbi:TetR/AcrR family transcriptional regulator [Fuscibacter oryzae]|uniref:TetR family transcriptional regulator C-terminal domain-containing protein n=1 Tax=Fuscibacter oryzae TaxID=2803939 RepID=A0A8J7STJ0_9RHOB|nr:TetR family transcriptional regulator C-terminal domain-containing protein [Fuscibacter oryzae]MBL4926611.1 TetR family transcriptional regulator C-terminal domain-containing protein [Fuscibacter oryzae]